MVRRIKSVKAGVKYWENYSNVIVRIDVVEIASFEQLQCPAEVMPSFVSW